MSSRTGNPAFESTRRPGSLTASIALAAILAVLAVSCSDDGSPVAPVNNPPRAPSSPVPADGTEYGAPLLTVSWECSDPDGDALVYSVNVREIGAVDTYTVFSGQTPFETMETGMALLRETSYIWRVIASDGRVLTEGPWWLLTTPEWTNSPPYEPSDPTPADGLAGIGLVTYLAWVAGDPDAEDFLTFDLFFGDTDPPTLEATGLTQTSYTLPALEFGTEYFWRIVSRDSKGESTAGPVWSFTTIPQPGLFSRLAGAIRSVFD